MHSVPVIEDILYKEVYAEQKLLNQVQQMDVVTGSRPVPWGSAFTRGGGLCTAQKKGTYVFYDGVIIIIALYFLWILSKYFSNSYCSVDSKSSNLHVKIWLKIWVWASFGLKRRRDLSDFSFLKGVLGIFFQNCCAFLNNYINAKFFATSFGFCMCALFSLSMAK